MKTEVVLKFNFVLFKVNTFTFNENRGCIEINVFFVNCYIFFSLMKTEVVLKYLQNEQKRKIDYGLMKTEVVLKYLIIFKGVRFDHKKV